MCSECGKECELEKHWYGDKMVSIFDNMDNNELNDYWKSKRGEGGDPL